jgi:recombination protein RecT
MSDRDLMKRRAEPEAPPASDTQPGAPSTPPASAEAPPAAAAVATRKPAGMTLRQNIEGEAFRAQIAKALPRHLTPDRFIRVAITALTRTPKLAECDQASFFKCLLDLSSLGLEPDGRRAHLIPFENRQRECVECQLIIDYKGLVELVMRSGNVANIHADVVCDKDEFAYDRGEIVKHTIDFRGDRGSVYAAYAVATFKDGTKKAEVLSLREIDGIRARSRAGQSGPWKTDWNEMAKKTAFRRLSKWLPFSAEIRDALELDDDRLADDLAGAATAAAPRPLKRAAGVTASPPAAAEATPPPADTPSDI